MIKIKRAYDRVEKKDGYRVLIDRLWPRGIRKDDLPLDEWAKELAPSADLRKAFGHDPGKWKQFRAGYLLELREPEAKAKLHQLATKAQQSDITLVYAARDTQFNNAVVVRDLLERLAERKFSAAKSSRRAA
jgi:uncharacterized protein YeaO (DUF488 family)